MVCCVWMERTLGIMSLDFVYCYTFVATKNPTIFFFYHCSLDFLYFLGCSWDCWLIHCSSLMQPHRASHLLNETECYLKFYGVWSSVSLLPKGAFTPSELNRFKSCRFLLIQSQWLAWTHFFHQSRRISQGVSKHHAIGLPHQFSTKTTC